jgi:hypothetical protein
MREINLLFIVLGLAFISFFVNADSITVEQNHELSKLESSLEQETPLQFSARNLRDFFLNHSIPTVSLKGREKQLESRTSMFNKTFVKYLKEVYNKSYYSKMLSQDGTHIIDFLELSNELNLDVSTSYVCFRLFYNKIKECEIVDDSVVNQILEVMPKLLKKHFCVEKEETKSPSRNFNFLQNNIEDIILTKFTDEIEDFQRTPDVFVSDLSTEISRSIEKNLKTIDQSLKKYEEKNIEKMETINRFRQTIVKFFEISLSKTLWNISSYEGIWQSFLSIANNLQLLGVHSVLDHMDDLDDLHWSLVHRFCYFLDLTGSVFPEEFYNEIEEDLASKAVYFLEVKEQDEGIKTKKETIIDALVHAKTKSIAYTKMGIISQPMV